ncbi:MAG: hypothetical protein LC745_01485 [Planctomycetia bacterium]|nr:hypothetical protein [Planctomycetia bacterium]
MAQTFWAGKNAAFSFGGVVRPAKKFDIMIETADLDTTSTATTAVGWRDYIPGFSRFEVSAEGPLDTSLVQFVTNATAAFVATIGTLNTITGTCLVKSLTYGQDVEGNAVWRLKASGVGSPTITLA